MTNGQCYLNYLTPTSIANSVYDGNTLIIGGVERQMTLSGGDVMTNAGLAPNTVYNVYERWVVGHSELFAHTSDHHFDPIFGNEVADADHTWSLVGKIRTNGAAQFVDTNTQRFVLSWFNRHVLNLYTEVSGLIGSPSWQEVNSSKRLQYLTWGYSQQASASGWTGCDSVSNIDTMIKISADGISWDDMEGCFHDATHSSEDCNKAQGFGFTSETFIGAEGFRMVSLFGRSSAGTCTWASNGTAPGEHTSIKAVTLG